VGQATSVGRIDRTVVARLAASQRE